MKENQLMTDTLSFRIGKPVEELFSIDVNMVLRLYGADGNLKDERLIHNTVTIAGKNAAADQLLLSPTLGKPTHMAVGTGAPATTLLGAETARVALTLKTRSGSVVTMQGDFAAGIATGAITEAGIFDIVTANTVNMHESASFSAINKGASDTLSISWALTFA